MNSVGSPVQNREQDSHCGDHDATVVSVPKVLHPFKISVLLVV